MPSFYQNDLFRSLAKTGRVDLEVIYARNLDEDRLLLGWQANLNGYKYRFLDERRPVWDASRTAYRQAGRMHILNGLWAVPAFASALSLLNVLGSRVVIYSEIPERLKYERFAAPQPKWKRLLQKAFSLFVVPRLSGVLSISHFSADYFNELGVAESLIYPFGYFRAEPQVPPPTRFTKKRANVEITFVGRLVPLKRLDLLLEAAIPLLKEDSRLRLNFVGTGELLETLRAQVAESGCGERVSFEGTLSFDSIPARLARTDVLVLPSEGEGWGLVVNEALSVGTPVIISDRCGAADLIRDGENGFIFRTGDAASLELCLRNFLAAPSEWARWRRTAARIGGAISTEGIAPYLVECLQRAASGRGEKPVPPWIKSWEQCQPETSEAYYSSIV